MVAGPGYMFWGDASFAGLAGCAGCAGCGELGAYEEYGADAAAKCERLRARYKRLRKKYKKGGRRILGIKVGSGQKRLARLKRRADRWCAKAKAEDPQRAFKMAYEAAAAGDETQEAMLQAALAPTTDGAGSLLVPVLAIGGVGLLAMLFLMMRR